MTIPSLLRTSPATILVPQNLYASLALGSGGDGIATHYIFLVFLRFICVRFGLHGLGVLGLLSGTGSEGQDWFETQQPIAKVCW